MQDHEQIIKAGKGKIVQFVFILFIAFFLFVLLSAVIYAFILYRDIILLIPCLFISIIFCLCIGSTFFYPVRVIVNNNILYCSFIFDKRIIPLKEILWMKKMLPRMSFKSNRALLLIIFKVKEYKFPYNYCIFRIYGKGFGLFAKNYTTLLDELMK